VVPLALYILGILVQTAASAVTRGVRYSLGALPLLAVSHILYGLGFWRGLFTSLDPGKGLARAEVRLERIPL
jgi:hypothetical protein